MNNPRSTNIDKSAYKAYNGGGKQGSRLAVTYGSVEFSCLNFDGNVRKALGFETKIKFKGVTGSPSIIKVLYVSVLVGLSAMHFVTTVAMPVDRYLYKLVWSPNP